MKDLELLKLLLEGKQFKYTISGLHVGGNRMSELYRIKDYGPKGSKCLLQIVPTIHSVSEFTPLRESLCANNIANELDNIYTAKHNFSKRYEARIFAHELVLQQYCSMSMFDIFDDAISSIEIKKRNKQLWRLEIRLGATTVELYEIKDEKPYVRREPCDMSEKPS